MSEHGLIGETLECLRGELESRVVPFVHDPDGALAAAMISDLLVCLTAWHLDPPDAEPPDPARARACLAPVFPVEGEAWARHAGALQEAIESSPRPTLELLRSAVEAESSVLAAHEPRGQVFKRDPTVRLAKVEVVMTNERAQDLVDACRGPGLKVTSFSRVPGGFSKDSFFVNARGPAGVEEEFVIRRDLPFGPGENSVADEYRLLATLREQGFPIAQPFGCDTTGIVGQPALLSRRVEGNSGTSPWDEDVEERRSICLQLAAVLARLHGLPPQESGVSVSSTDPREQLRAYVLEWRDRWRRNRVHASPALAGAFEWLLANQPPAERLATLHGDVGFHNALVHEGRITAVLDWEFAHAGDPTEDLSYCRPLIETLVPWNDFLAAYREAGGGPYLEENARFFELWRSVRNAVCCAVSWRGFVSGRYPALKMAYQGIPLYRGFVLSLASRFREAMGAT